MNIILYRMSCEVNRVDKSNYISKIVTLNGTLREVCSITQPSIDFFLTNQILTPDNDMSTIVDSSEEVLDGGNVSNTQRYDIGVLVNKIISCNYMYIPTFNRYYFIDDIISVRNNLWRIVAHVDVLMSFKKEIMQQNLLINRNEYDYDLFLIDNRIPSKLDFVKSEYTPYIRFKLIKDLEGSTYNINFDPCYVVTAINRDYKGHTETMELGEANNICPSTTTYVLKNINSINSLWQGILDPTFIDSLTSFFQNKADFITSIKVFPFDLYGIIENSPRVSANAEGDLRIDQTEISGALCKSINANTRITFYCEMEVTDEIPKFNDFTDLSPYSKYYIFLPFYGIVEVDGCKIKNGEFKYIVYMVDIVSGDFMCYPTKKIDGFGGDEFGVNEETECWKGNMTVPVTMGSTNQNQIWQNLTTMGISAALAVVTGGVSLAAGAAMSTTLTDSKGNLTKQGQRYAINRVEQTGKGALNEIKSFALDSIKGLVPTAHADLPIGNILNHRMDTEVHIYKYKPSIFFPDNYNHTFGRPLFQERKMGEVKGYTLVYDAHLQGFTDATSEEQSEISSILESGVFMPDE